MYKLHSPSRRAKGGRKENMYWMISNHGQAQISTLNQMIGKLESMIEYEATATPKELLEYIQKTVAEEEKRLDEKFPECARITKEN